jgi:hypothetical protein
MYINILMKVSSYSEHVKKIELLIKISAESNQLFDKTYE